MVSAIDKMWSTQGTYEQRRQRMIRQVSTEPSKQKGFYQRTTQADLYRITVITTRTIARTKRTLGRTCTVKGPLDADKVRPAAMFVAKQSLWELVRHAEKYSEPLCTVCLGPIGKSTRAVQINLDSWFTNEDHDRERIWAAFRVCSERCRKKASVLE